jgi:hypothetical protein
MRRERLLPLATLLIVLMVVTGGCGVVGSMVETEPDFTGEITEIHADGGEGVVGQVLAEAKVVTPDTEYLDKYMVTVRDDTTIFEEVGEERQPAGFEALAVGQRVQVWFTGPIAESYPAQVAARQIVVIS